jgi:monofunctional biosynthetic peptidoglycan transglycosylase
MSRERAHGRGILHRRAWLLGGAVAAGMFLLALYVAVLWARLPSVAGLGAVGAPPPTAFMRGSGCARVAVVYRPLAEIDPRLGCAVVWAEDARFFRHDGVDRQELGGVMRTGWHAGRLGRGASTIPMQLAKNLFLSPARTPTRKLAEILLARRLVARYDRLRVLELYLNTAELAPCVYGAEAGARHYFGHGTEVLDGAEATFLAALLPRPGHPPGSLADDRTGLQRKQRRLLELMRHGGLLSTREAMDAVKEVVLLWLGGWAGHASAAPEPAPQSWYARECGTDWTWPSP